MWTTTKFALCALTLWTARVCGVALCVRDTAPFIGAEILGDGSVVFSLSFPTGGYQQGWAALGVRSTTCTSGTNSNCMAGADLFVVTASNQFEFWRLPNGSQNGMPTKLNAAETNFGLVTASVCCANGASKDITLRRTARGGGVGSVELTVNALQTYLWAYSTSNTFASGHGPTRRGTITINLGSG